MKQYYIFTVLVLLLINGQKLYAQEESTAYSSKLMVKVSAGVNMPLTDMNQNKETDYLIEYSNKTKVIPSLGLIWFPKKHFGVEFNLKFINFSEQNKARDHFKNDVMNQFGENYYVNVYQNSFDPSPVISFGLVYRIETERMFFHPKIAIGATSFSASWANATLKEKNSNLEYKLDYSAGDQAKDHFTVIPSISAGYKLSKRFWVDASVNSSFFKSDFLYQRTFTNLYTNEVEVENYQYKKSVVDAYVSLGVTYILARKKN